MKKLFIVLAVASLGFVACNNEAETETPAIDSAAYKDSVEKAAAAAAAAIDTAAAKLDSAAAVVDSLKK